MKSVLLVFLIWFSPAFAAESTSEISIKPRIPSLATFPCTKCHKKFMADPIKWVIPPKEHKEMIFSHMPEIQNCQQCHSSSRPDQLNLLDGTLVTYDQVYRVCSQCHGKIGYNWEYGLHGRQTGYWNGPKVRLSCSECHNPHRPKFQPAQTVANPIESPYIIRKKEEL